MPLTSSLWLNIGEKGLRLVERLVEPNTLNLMKSQRDAMYQHTENLTAEDYLEFLMLQINIVDKRDQEDFIQYILNISRQVDYLNDCYSNSSDTYYL